MQLSYNVCQFIIIWTIIYFYQIYDITIDFLRKVKTLKIWCEYAKTSYQKSCTKFVIQTGADSMWGQRVNRPHLPPLVYCIFNLKFDIYVIWPHLYNIIVFTYFIHNSKKNYKTIKDLNECSKSTS